MGIYLMCQNNSCPIWLTQPNVALDRTYATRLSYI